MNQEEIKTKIIELNEKAEKRINAQVSVGQFIYDKELANILKEIEELQTMCCHEYKDGNCCYCGKNEGDINE